MNSYFTVAVLADFYLLWALVRKHKLSYCLHFCLNKFWLCIYSHGSFIITFNEIKQNEVPMCFHYQLLKLLFDGIKQQFEQSTAGLLKASMMEMCVYVFSLSALYYQSVQHFGQPELFLNVLINNLTRYQFKRSLHIKQNNCITNQAIDFLD